MKIYHSLTEVPAQKRPVSLVIGMFDGLHTGHKYLLKSLKKERGTSIVLTFKNHPKEVITEGTKVPILTSAEDKVRELAKCGIDGVIILPFTKDIAHMTYQMFLKEVYNAVPFEHLCIGENDAFGKNREGNKEALQKFGRELRFTVTSLPKLEKDGEIVSSSRIRKHLIDGELKKAENLLGRPLSFRVIDKGLIKSGVYNVRILQDGENTFRNKVIHIDENSPFELNYPSTITFITEEENQ